MLIEIKQSEVKAPCPHCGRLTQKVHQNHSHRVRDLSFGGYDIFLQINRRQLKCPHCHKIFSEDLYFVKKRRTYTKRLGQKVLKEVLETNIESAAKRNRMTPAEIETLLKEAEEEFLTEKPNFIKKLGIDEITQLKGGKNYAAVLVDLETKKPIELLEKRNKETLSEYLDRCGKELLSSIEEVSIDLWRPYKSVIQEKLPNAQIVADRFHVMKQINEELDSKRKREKRAAEKQKKSPQKEQLLQGLTHSKYPLLKKR